MTIIIVDRNVYRNIRISEMQVFTLLSFCAFNGKLKSESEYIYVLSLLALLEALF